MKVGKWRIEFKTTITGKYKDVKEVPFWRVYIVRREPKFTIDKETGEILNIYKQMVVYQRSVVAMTYDEIISTFKNLRKLYIGGIEVCPEHGMYVVAYPRKSCKTRV